MCLFYSLMCLCVFSAEEGEKRKRDRGKQAEERGSADERLFMVNRGYVITLSLSLYFSLLLFLRPSETWLSLFSEMKDARHGASKQKCRQSQTNLQMKNIKGAAPIVSLSCPGKIGSLRPKNDIVYINRGPWLDATMFVRLCCPPSLLPLPTGHFSLPPAQSFLWRLSLRW